MNRRELLRSATAFMAMGGLAAINSHAEGPPAARACPARPANRIAVSTYSFWQFHADSKVTIEDCITMAREIGFDAVEILEAQMYRKDNAYLQSLKRLALLSGLDLCGLSAHQGFVSPKPEERKVNIARTIASIELAYAMGIPAVRRETGDGSCESTIAHAPAAVGIHRDAGWPTVVP